MPTTLSVFKVFISCPSDMTECKQALEHFITTHLNPIYNKQGKQIQALTWENNVFSKMGEPAQDTINDQIGSYDIYIGIMGKRFGSPTTNYDSGTEEEYRKAFEQYKADKSVRVSFFFQNASVGTGVTENEMDQFTKVYNFRKSLGSDGLYSTFNDKDDFVPAATHIITDHLNSVDQKSNSEQSEIEIQYPMLAEVPNKTIFRLSKEFYTSFINSLEASVRSSKAEEVTLEDIYVAPDLRVLTHEVDENNQPVGEDSISADALLDYKEVPSVKYFVGGDEKAGKTTFCKQLYKSYHSSGLVPVYIYGGDIKNANYDDLKKRILSAFKEQYSDQADVISAFLALHQSKILIIIDDLHVCKLNTKYKIQLIEKLEQDYSHIICTADSVFLIDGYINAEKETKNLQGFKKYQIKDIGYKVRYDLITRWNLLGVKETISNEELHSKSQAAMQTIDEIIGTNIVPRKPFVILVLLQALETGNTSNLADSSMVRYYEYLITTGLLHHIHKEKLELYFGFLPELAYSVFMQEKGCLTNEEMDALLQSFSKRKGLSPKDLSEVKTNLFNFKILSSKNDAIKYNHDYAFFYFLGKYFSARMTNPEVIEHIKNLCSHLYIERNANIIVFLAYHTNDPAIMESIVAIADTLFKDESLFEFDDSSQSPINQLVHDCPKLVFDHGKAASIKKKSLKVRDEIEERVAEPESKQAIQVFSDINELEFSAKLYLTFKTIQILGQLLKNHYVSLDAKPKEEIFKSASSLGLRCLNQIITMISNDIDTLTEIIKEIDPKAKDEKSAKRGAFDFASFIIFAFIKGITQSVGAEKLSMTFAEVLKDNPHKAMQIVGLAIKLDFFDNVPLKELEQIVPEIKSNKIAYHTVRRLVRNRLYMRPIEDFRVRQQLCDVAGIDLSKQIALEQKKKKRDQIKPILIEGTK